MTYPMKLKIATFIDEILGRIIVNIVSLIPPYPKPISSSININNILVLKFWGMGSILQATPLLENLKIKYTDAQLDILTFSSNRQIVESLGLFQNIYTIDWSLGIPRFLIKTILFILKNLKRYTMVIDIEFFSMFSALLTKALARDYSLGFGGFYSGRNRIYSKTVIFDHSTHIRLIFLKFLNALNIEIPSDIKMIPPNITIKDTQSVDNLYPILKKEVPKIAVNINTGELCMNRRWPINHFKALIDQLSNKYSDLIFFLIGSKDDTSYVESLYISLKNKERVYMTTGILNIVETVYLLKHMTFLITNDSGPLHISEAIGTPVVSFFGPETPNLFGPTLTNSMVFYLNMYCSPCLNTYTAKKTTCKNNFCLNNISSDQVYKKICKVYFRDNL